ncbi:MAG: hypothetical protein J0I09_07435, partial [Sphingobacteriia bacterium]|nr:hypothetical protein [Sphingobacteriia bacterium]
SAFVLLFSFRHGLDRTLFNIFNIHQQHHYIWLQFKRDETQQPRHRQAPNVGSNAMTDLNDITKLDNYEAEDIGDVVVKLEKSFGIKFDKTAFSDVKTFGDLCDVFENNINYENYDDCTKQQAFYRIRKAISTTQLIDENEIKLDSKLVDLFPRHNRRQKANEFQSYVGTDIKILTYPGWLALTFIVIFLLSLFAFFFDWKIALSGIVFSIISIKVAEKFGKGLDLKTVRQLTEKAARENYTDIRRTNKTINRKEIVTTIIETFSNDLDIDKDHLTRDAKFSWA